MHFLLRVVILKQHLRSGVWSQRESFRREASPAARGDTFQVKILASWVCPYRNYRFSFTLLRLDIFVCPPHSSLEPPLPLPTGISWWNCWDSALMHVSMCYTPLLRWKEKSMCGVSPSLPVSLPFSHTWMRINVHKDSNTHNNSERYTQSDRLLFFSLTHIHTFYI